MSYYSPVIEAGPRQRPGGVSAAGYLLYAVTALSVIAAGVTFAQVGTIGNAARDAAKPTENPDTLAAATQTVVVILGVICILVGVMFAVCAAYNMRGRNGMRITTWVLGGLFVLCLGCSAVGNGAGAAIGTTTTSSGSTSSSQVVANSFPTWYHVSTAVLESVSVILLLVAIILLAIPSSNAYFRKPDPMLMTMMPGVAYQMPVYPGIYPPAGPQMPYQQPQVPGQYLPNPGGPLPQDPPTAPDPNWPAQR